MTQKPLLRVAIMVKKYESPARYQIYVTRIHMWRDRMRDDHKGDSEHTDFQLLTTEEFCRRFGIGRTKLFEMKKAGTLVRGRHYMQFGRKLLFPWGPEFLQRLLSDCIVVTSPPSRLADQKDDNRRGKPARGKRQPGINADYCLQG